MNDLRPLGEQVSSPPLRRIGENQPYVSWKVWVGDQQYGGWKPLETDWQIKNAKLMAVGAAIDTLYGVLREKGERPGKIRMEGYPWEAEHALQFAHARPWIGMGIGMSAPTEIPL